MAPHTLQLNIKTMTVKAQNCHALNDWSFYDLSNGFSYNKIFKFRKKTEVRAIIYMATFLQAVYYLILPVILWSQLEQHSMLIKSECPKCRMEGTTSLLTPNSWTNGHLMKHQPRSIHCVDCNTHLVSHVYHCHSGHTVLGHYSEILQAFKQAQLQSMLPFQLWDITGLDDTGGTHWLQVPANREGPYWATNTTILHTKGEISSDRSTCICIP